MPLTPIASMRTHMCRYSSRAIFLLICALSISPSTHADARFRNLTKENALPTGTAFNILQDSQGYMWLATSTGLERYDGYKFTVFKHKPSDPASLASDFVKALYLDSSGRLWIGTYGGGLDLYLPETGTFRHYRHAD